MHQCSNESTVTIGEHLVNGVYSCSLELDRLCRVGMSATRESELPGRVAPCYVGIGMQASPVEM